MSKLDWWLRKNVLTQYEPAYTFVITVNLAFIPVFVLNCINNLYDMFILYSLTLFLFTGK